MKLETGRGGRIMNTRKHNIINDGRKENGIHHSPYGATNGKCNNCNSYKESCTCTGNAIPADHPRNQYSHQR